MARDGCGGELNGRGVTGPQVGAVCGHGRWRLARVLAQDEARLVLQVGDVLHHALLVGDGELVGAIGDEVEVAGDEDQRERQHGHNDQGEAHGQRPWGVALETLHGLQDEKRRQEKKRKQKNINQIVPDWITDLQ